MKTFRNAIIISIAMLFTSNLLRCQDIIILRNGEELMAKILEVKQTEITYKSWKNIDGPTYTKNKADVFMIKYSNGSKDVFELEKTPAENSSKTASNQFIGTWFDKKFNGKTNQSCIIITSAGENFLVEAKMRVYLDNIWGKEIYDTQGSFREVGHYENGSIVINSDTKLSLINNNTLLMNGTEYIKNTKNESNSSKETPKKVEAKVEPIYTGEYKDNLKHGKGKLTFADGSFFEGEWKNDSPNGYGSYTTFDKESKEKWTTSGYWVNGNIVADSLITIYWDDEIFEKGFYKEGSLWEGIRQARVTNYSWPTHRYFIEILVDGKVKKII